MFIEWNPYNVFQTAFWFQMTMIPTQGLKSYSIRRQLFKQTVIWVASNDPHEAAWTFTTLRMHQLGANGLDILLKLEKGPDMKLPGSKVDHFSFIADKVFSIAHISEKPFN